MPPKTSKPGKRHELLVYQRMVDRLWLATLFLGGLVLLIWWGIEGIFPVLYPPYDTLTLSGGILLVIIALGGRLMRSMAYVQAMPDHIRLSTPFLRLKIAYRRVRTVHPMEFKSLYQPSKTGWAMRRFLNPFYGKTVLVVDLHSFPIRPGALRLFLPRLMFSPKSRALVFVVADWMALSTEIDSQMGAWLQRSVASQRPVSPEQALLQSLRKTRK